MIAIFAKLGTDEKIVTECQRSEVGALCRIYESQFGGRWVFADQCTYRLKEVIKFKDGQVYKGFEPDKPKDYRYSPTITKISYF